MRKTATIAAFLLILLCPTIFTYLGEAGGLKLNEQRNLSGFPAIRWNVKSLVVAPAALESYYNDHFGLRSLLVSWDAFFKFKYFGQARSAAAVIGQDGWLYLGEMDHSVDNFRGVRPFSDDELAHAIHILEERATFLNEWGIPYVIFFAPNKETIYPEFYPSYIKRVSTRGRLDQILEGMHRSADEERWLTWDMREPLFKAKSKARVYQKTDTHWDLAGALISYASILDRISTAYGRKLIPETYPLKWTEGGAGDLANMLGVAPFLTETRPDFAPGTPFVATPASAIVPLSIPGLPPEAYAAREVKGSDGPQVVFFHDSFGELLLRPLAEKSARLVDVRSNQFDMHVVEAEEPNVVVQEIVERALDHLDHDPNLPDLTEFSRKAHIFRARPAAGGPMNVMISAANPLHLNLQPAHTGEPLIFRIDVKAYQRGEINITTTDSASSIVHVPLIKARNVVFVEVASDKIADNRLTLTLPPKAESLNVVFEIR